MAELTSDLPAPQVFDRCAMRNTKRRAGQHLETHAFLFEEAADRLAERLADINRTFDTALLVGDCIAALARHDRVRTAWSVGTWPGAAAQAVIDEEWLPFAEQSVDLIVANLTLHWANDLPGALIQMNRSLRPDGLLMATLFGGTTLAELREVLMAAELETTGGAAPRISPFADLRDLGGLLQRAGFAMPVTDSDRITVTYPGFSDLLADLKGMGETNAVAERSKTMARRDMFARAGEIYAERFADTDGRLQATFDIQFLTGWAPGPGQPKPKRPGSATARLAEALGTREISGGVKAGP